MCKSDAEVIDKIIAHIMNGDLKEARDCYNKAMSELELRLKEVTDENEELSSMLNCIYLMMEGECEHESYGVHSSGCAVDVDGDITVHSNSDKNV